MFQEALGAVVKDLQVETGFIAADVARRGGLNSGNLSRWLRGKKVPSEESMEGIAKGYKISLSALAIRVGAKMIELESGIKLPNRSIEDTLEAAALLLRFDVGEMQDSPRKAILQEMNLAITLHCVTLHHHVRAYDRLLRNVMPTDPQETA